MLYLNDTETMKLCLEMGFTHHPHLNSAQTRGQMQMEIHYILVMIKHKGGLRLGYRCRRGGQFRNDICNYNYVQLKV